MPTATQKRTVRVPTPLLQEVLASLEPMEPLRSFIMAAIIAELSRRYALRNGVPTTTVYTCHAPLARPSLRPPAVSEPDIDWTLL